jgi:hypothetical protein
LKKTMRHLNSSRRNVRAGGRYAAASVVVLLLVSLLGCPGFDDPASPNNTLTGPNPNATGSFSGVISITGQAGSVPADGTTDVLVGARAVDAAGNPIANGIAINFATSLGTIRASGADPATAGSSTPVVSFEGQAVVAVRSSASGVAEVTAWIADDASMVTIEFEGANLEGTVDMTFRTAGGDTPSIVTTAPTNALIVGTAKDTTGVALAGVHVRFKIDRDTTASSGKGEAYFGGPPLVLTNSSGEAYNTLFVNGVGEVVVFSRLLDPSTCELISESGPITLITTEIQATTSISLTLDSGATTGNGTVDTPEGMTARVFSERTGDVLVGIPVRFRIVSDTTDTAVFDPAELANPLSSATNSLGQAFNAIIAHDSGAVVVLEVEALDPATGSVIARSNQIVYTVS